MSNNSRSLGIKLKQNLESYENRFTIFRIEKGKQNKKNVRIQNKVDRTFMDKHYKL
jgi:hypothetical protein